MSWTLSNGEEIHAANPITFEIPDEWERKSLQPGSIVKLIFIPESTQNGGPGGERMWVQVTENVADGSYIGVLDNQPAFINDLKYGDKIAFKPENVISILPEDI